MKITEIKVDTLPDLDVAVGSSGLPRSETQHVSDILRNIAIKTGIIKPRESNTAIFEMGFVWEETLSTCFANRHARRPGEVEHCGITGSPDGITSGNDNQLMLEEYKCTWKSLRTIDIAGQWYWMAQIKAYLKLLQEDMGITEANTAILHVLFVNGDYSGSGTQYRVYMIKFTQREIDDNWNMIVNNKSLG